MEVQRRLPNDKTDLSYVFTSKLNLDDEKREEVTTLAEKASKLVLATCTGKLPLLLQSDVRWCNG